MYSRVYRTKLNWTPVTRLLSPVHISMTQDYGAHGLIKLILSEILAVSIVRFVGVVLPMGEKKN